MALSSRGIPGIDTQNMRRLAQSKYLQRQECMIEKPKTTRIMVFGRIRKKAGRKKRDIVDDVYDRKGLYTQRCTKELRKQN